MSSEDLPKYTGVTEADLVEQSNLPLDHSLARPGVEDGRAYCPFDGREVTHALRGHHVDGDRLIDRRTPDVEVAPVYGYKCPYCQTVLAIDPSSGAVDLPGPGTGREGWIAVRADLDDGPGHVLVPWGVARP